MAEEINIQVYMEGLSRVDRVVDNSGFAFTSLDISEKELGSLEPIKSYTHLQFVNVSKNQIVDASPLSELQYLICVDLSNNNLNTTPSLPQQYLQSLDLSGNQIAALQGLESSSLTVLKINGNTLSSLVGLQSLPSLTTLEVSRNVIEDISSLSNDTAPKLETLYLEDNKITTLNGIESLSALTSLSLQQNYIEALESVQQLEQLTKLTTLDLTGNPVTQAEDYRISIILLAPTLTQLDGEAITDDDRLAALELKHRREAEATEQEEANE
ncbi:Protein phosphatase PP1 regulatory subunit Sds22 [Phytophthora palmivora]|uniref:Protein phosphatase PP1 regulatory subunit Sds22 n=1 Tax=Phytophthora palmivora TaxID=4796 RepID=A0A2P4XER7_9STRA|nr:Protein phosphatase PP1 regulatory subunit Sds22 [Phytophthora palmivora]